MSTIDRATLVATAETLLALADALEPAEPIKFFGVELKPGEGWRMVVKGYEAERLANLAKPAPFGREADGTPRPPPALAACTHLIDAATREAWPGPHDHPFSRWDYVRGLEQLGVGGVKRDPPRYAGNPQGLEDDILWLGFSEAGHRWLSHAENRAVTDPAYVRRFGFRPVRRRPDGELEELP